jgi:hypothetical protein
MISHDYRSFRGESSELRNVRGSLLDTAGSANESQTGKRLERMGMWFVGWKEVAEISNPLQGRKE